MEAVRVKVPDISAELDKLKAEMKQLGPDATVEQIGRIQSEIGRLQSRIGEIQSHAGEEQGKLGDEMGVLGEKQGKLGQQQGELGRQVEEHQCGFAIEEGDVDSLESAITLLFHDPDLCAKMGHRARSMLDHHFTRRQAFDDWQTLISKVEFGQL